MTLGPRQYLGLGLACAIAFWGPPSKAEVSPSSGVALEYRADPGLGCPDAIEFGASVTRQLGYDPFTGGAAEQKLSVTISRVAERAEAQIEWFNRQQSSEGERRLSSESGTCAELARNLAFAVAVQIQLHAAETEATPSGPAASHSAPPAPPVSPARPPLPAPKPQPRAPSEGPAPRLLIGAGAMAEYGLTPGIAPAIRVLGAVAEGLWLLELSGHASASTSLQQADGTGFVARELGGTLAPCIHLAPWGLCAVGGVGVLQVRGEGVDRAGSPSSVIGTVGGRVQLHWPELRRWGVLLQGQVAAVLTPRDVLLNQTQVWSTAPVTVTVSLDFYAIFR